MSYEFVEIPDVDESQLLKVFDTISGLISKSISESPDTGGKTLASIHYKLFLDHFEKNEKARLALMYLQAQLGKLISDSGKSREVGMLIYAYTRHWLRFVLILESQMATLLSWYTFQKELPINLVPIISTIEERLPILVDNKAPGLPEGVIRDFRDFADAANDDAGEELKNWLLDLMRNTIFHEDKPAQETLAQFQKSFPDLMNVDPFNVAFNTLFHQYGESWFNEIAKRKKWLNILIKELDLYNEKNIQKLARGYYWRKMGDPNLRLTVWRNVASRSPKAAQEMSALRKELGVKKLDLGID